MAAKVKKILRRQEPVFFKGGKWQYQDYEFEVVVMAVSGIYAMVRRPGCNPFVAQTKELHDPQD